MKIFFTDHTEKERMLLEETGHLIDGCNIRRTAEVRGVGQSIWYRFQDT